MSKSRTEKASGEFTRLQTYVPKALLQEIRRLTEPEELKTPKIVHNALHFYRVLLQHKGKPLTITMNDNTAATVSVHPILDQTPT